MILNKIKINKNDNDNDNEKNEIEESKQKIIYEFNDLIKELSKEKNKQYKIFYNIKMESFLDGKYKFYIIFINDDIISQNFQEMNEYDNIILKKTKLKIQNSSSKESKRGIEKKIYYKTIKIYNKLEKSSNKVENNKNNNENIFEKINENNINKENDNIKENSDNKEIKKKESIKIMKFEYTRISNNIEYIFNQIKIDIINKKETFPVKMMFKLSIIFLIVTILFLIIHEKITENSFQHLSTFLDENIFFNLTKMGVAVLYISSINIKWQLHYCSFNTFYNITLLTEQMLIEDLDFLQWIKDFTNNLGIEFDDILRKKYIIGLDIYEVNNNEIYKLNNDNLLNYFVNRGIHLLKIYPSLLNYFSFKETHNLEPIEINSELNELNNLANQTYFYCISDLNGFIGEEKNKKINEILFNFPIAFIFIGLFLLGLFIFYIFYALIINNIEIYLIERIINFNFKNLELYLKQLEEIKKKIGSDFVNEEEKENTDSNFKVTSFNEEEEEEENKIDENKKYNFHKKKNYSLNYRKRKIKIKKFRKYFFRKTIIFIIQILIIIILYLLFWIISILIGKNKEKEFIDFDSINDSMIGLFKQSYDIFISLKRQLELYENRLTNCQIDNRKNIYELVIPSISSIKNTDLGDAIMKITAGLGHKSESLNNLTEMVNGNACKFLTNNQEEYSICSNYFWNGILLKGIEQTKVKMGDILKSIIDELKSINTEGRTFNEIIKSSTYSLYELFIEFYYQRAYRIIDNLFWDIRKGKLSNILKLIRNVLIIGFIFSMFLFIILIYFIFEMKNIFSSFLNFIAILPQKYVFEDDNFYNDIIRICKNNF